MGFLLISAVTGCGTDGGSDSIFENSGTSGGGGGGVGFGSSGPSVSPGSPSSCSGSDPSDNIPVDIPQKNGNTWVMAKTRLGTITKYNIYSSLTSYYTDRSNQVQTQMAFQNNIPGMAGSPMLGASGTLLPSATPVMSFPGSFSPPPGGMMMPGMPQQGGGFAGGGFQGGGGYPQAGMNPMMNPQMNPYQQQAYMQQGLQQEMQQGAFQAYSAIQQQIGQLRQQGYTEQQIIQRLMQEEGADKASAEQSEEKLEEEIQKENKLTEDKQECAQEIEQWKKKLETSEEEKNQLKEVLAEFQSLIHLQEGESPIDALKRMNKELGIEPEVSEGEERNSSIDLLANDARRLANLPEPSAPPLDDLEQLEREEDSEEEEEVGDLEGKFNNWTFNPRNAPKKLTKEQSEQLQVLREARAVFLEALGKPTTLPFKLTQEQEWAYLVRVVDQLRMNIESLGGLPEQQNSPQGLPKPLGGQGSREGIKSR